MEQAKVITPWSRPGRAFADLRLWPRRRWVAAAAGAVLGALLIGVPTDIVPTPLFERMTPVTWWDYPLWATSAVLLGLIVATYIRAESAPRGEGHAARAVGGGILSVFAVGCPICNKLVILALGTGGALSYFAPIQPFLGLASVLLLLTTLTVRMRGLAACAYPRAGEAGALTRQEGA